MHNGDLIDLDITDVAHGGVFVGRHGADAETAGRVVFVADAIPGERVRVRLTDVGRPAFWRGETLEVLDASPHRRPHVWRQADVAVPPDERPGGADFGHIELAHQRTLKRAVLGDALRRIGHLDLPEVDVEPAADAADADGAAADAGADGTRWRTRLSLHVDDEGRIGPYAARSHRVIRVADHPLATEAIERQALRLAAGRPGRIDLVQPADGRVRVLRRPDRPARASRGGRGGRPASAPGPALGAADPAREVVIERVRGREFRVSAGGFWQVHRQAAAALSGVVAELVRDRVDPDAWHLDLYGGVGLFAATLAELGGTRVTTVESDARATEHAGENLVEWLGARAETGRVDRWLAGLGESASARDRTRLSHGVIVLDPPRAGAGREVVRSIAALSPAAVVYVACDPVALARDLGTFRDAGYQTSRMRALDLFPHSHHLEAIALLTRDDTLTS